jgi:excisionase family DNA binding protein
MMEPDSQDRKTGIHIEWPPSALESQRASFSAAETSSAPVAREQAPRRHRPARRSNRVVRSSSGFGERLVDVNEAAAILALSPKTLYQWAYERSIPTIKLGSALRFRVSDLENLIQRAARDTIMNEE